MPRLLSCAKTVRQVVDRTKDVTRRDGWEFLQAGDVVEWVEWSPRAGRRWGCRECGWSCPPADYASGAWDGTCCPECTAAGDDLEYRKPRRLGQRRVVSVRRERLGDITMGDVFREGFPGRSPEWFVAMYCAPGKPDPDRMVTRIELEVIIRWRCGACGRVTVEPEKTEGGNVCVALGCGKCWGAMTMEML